MALFKKDLYYYLGSFQEDLAAVKDQNGWGFIDKTGREVIPCQFQDVSSFNEGLAKVQNQNNLWGFIDKTGREVIPCQFMMASYFHEGLAAVKNQNGLWGFKDKNGKEVILCQFEDVDVFHEGLVKVQNRNGLYGFIDINGKEVIPCQFRLASYFREGLAKVQNQNNLWGFIDKSGKEVISCQFQEVSNFNEGIAAVEDQYNYWGFIDKTGREVIPRQFMLASYFNEGLAAVKDQNGWGFIDKTGKEVIPCQFRLASYFHEGLVEVQNQKGLWGFIDKNGKEVIPCCFQDVDDFHEGLVKVQNRNGLYGFIDKSGKEVIPCQFKIASDFREGLAKVQNQNNLWGFIDKSGKEVISCQFKIASDFHEGLAKVQNQKDKMGYIDKQGNFYRAKDLYKFVNEEKNSTTKQSLNNITENLPSKLNENEPLDKKTSDIDILIYSINKYIEKSTIREKVIARVNSLIRDYNSKLDRVREQYLSGDFVLRPPADLKSDLKLQLELILDECKNYYENNRKYEEMLEYLNNCIKIDRNSDDELIKDLIQIYDICIPFLDESDGNDIKSQIEQLFTTEKSKLQKYLASTYEKTTGLTTEIDVPIKYSNKEELIYHIRVMIQPILFQLQKSVLNKDILSDIVNTIKSIVDGNYEKANNRYNALFTNEINSTYEECKSLIEQLSELHLDDDKTQKLIDKDFYLNRILNIIREGINGKKKLLDIYLELNIIKNKLIEIKEKYAEVGHINEI